MNSQDLIDKAISFYSNPSNTTGVDPREEYSKCKYHVNDNSKCGVGCLLENSLRFQELVDKLNEEDRSPYLSLYSIDVIASYVHDSRTLAYNTPEVVELRQMLHEIFPTDLPTLQEQIHFLLVLQVTHDVHATRSKDEFFPLFVKRLQERMSEAFPQLQLTYNYGKSTTVE